jgi:hypothetical protein
MSVRCFSRGEFLIEISQLLVTGRRSTDRSRAIWRGCQILVKVSHFFDGIELYIFGLDHLSFLGMVNI